MPVAGVLEVDQQRAVVRSDVDDEITRCEPELRRRLPAEVGEVVAQNPRRAAEVRVGIGKQHFRRNLEADLRQPAVLATKQLEGKRRLLDGAFADRGHRIDRGHIAEEQQRPHLRRRAYLAVQDRV
jgi:hypothetical protein